MKEIIGRKIGMTQVFAKDGTSYAVSVVEVLPNVVTQVKTNDVDGYSALQVGIEDAKESRLNKCEKGIFKKANVSGKQHLFEIKGDELTSYALGSEVKADIFKTGDIVDVIGTSKGRGYLGAIQRYGFAIGPKGHGSGYHRQVGSFANNGRCNNRVLPGKKMSGHHGNKSATIHNLLVVDVNIEKNYILIKGGIPGVKKSFVKIRSAVKTQKANKPTVKELVNNSVKVEVKTEVKAETINEAETQA